MRASGPLVLSLVLFAAVTGSGAQAPAPSNQSPVSAPSQASIDAAAKIIAAVRQALGGETKIAAVKTFTATGRTRQVRGDNLVPIEFEIACELPDKYMRKDEVPAQESGPTSTGFNGNQAILLPLPSPPPPDAARLARATAAKQDFARLMLGMFGGSSSAYPLTFAYVGQAESPTGKADVIDARGPANFTARLFVYSDTHLPIMVSWQAPAPNARGGPGPQARGGAPAAPAPMVENRMYYADYHEVDGLQLPFRLRRAVGADTVEETTFDRYRINAKIDGKKFDVR